MIHGVGYVQLTLGIDSNRRREIQQRPYRWSLVSAESLGNTGSLYDVAHGPAQIRLLGKAPFSRWTSLAERIIAGRAIRLHHVKPGVRRSTTSGYCHNGAGHSIHFSHDVIFRIRDEQIPNSVESQGFRFIQASFNRGPSVAGQTGFTVAGEGSHGANVYIDLHVSRDGLN
jgi:hypothetical protein